METQIEQPDEQQEQTDEPTTKTRKTVRVVSKTGKVYWRPVKKRGPKKKVGRKPKPKKRGPKRKRGRPKSTNKRKRISANGTTYWLRKRKKGKHKKPGRNKKPGPKVNPFTRWRRKNRVRINREQREKYRMEHPKKAGRPPKNWYPFEEARDLVRAEKIQSVEMYRKWWDRERPPKIPKWPYRVYKEFTTWNDWLGNNNTFEGWGDKITYRPFRELTAFARALKLTTREQWLQYIDDNIDTFPKDIPRHPDMFYDDWVSWYHFLGKRLGDKIKDIQDEIDPSVFYIYHDNHDPNNVYRISVEPKGVSGIMDRWRADPSFQVMKMFQYDNKLEGEIRRTINAKSTPYWGDNNVRLVPNLPDLIWTLSNIIPIVHPPK